MPNDPSEKRKRIAKPITALIYLLRTLFTHHNIRVNHAVYRVGVTEDDFPQ